MGRACGSWYFYSFSGALIVLDGGTGDFSFSMLPPTIPRLDVHFRENGFFVVDGRKARILVMEKDIMKVFVELDGEWSLKKQVQSYRW